MELKVILKTWRPVSQTRVSANRWLVLTLVGETGNPICNFSQISGFGVWPNQFFRLPHNL